jgi:ubiquinone/menaquinone biosynthesis C-methylase UbiE
MSSNPNRSIYNENYVPAQLEFATKTPYDSRVLELRLRLLDEHCTGKDVLDLCCGSGTYVHHLVDRAKSIVGIDFSRKLLEAAASKIQRSGNGKMTAFVEGDATSLPFAAASFDTVFSIASLYYVPNLQQAIQETARVLRPGGVAILDVGNSRSLATLVGRLCHRFYGWAKPCPVSYEKTLKAISGARLTIEQHHAFQILPLFGPRLVQLLLPFSTSLFKYPLGLTVHGRTLDSIISGAPLLRRIAFRHLFVVRKAQ